MGQRKRQADIFEPFVVAQYNSGIRDVDLLDMELLGLRPKIRGKK